MRFDSPPFKGGDKRGGFLYKCVFGLACPASGGGLDRTLRIMLATFYIFLLKSSVSVLYLGELIRKDNGNQMEEVEVQKMIEDSLPESHVEVVDTRGSGDHFEILVVSDKFEGVPLLDRHRMIHSALGSQLGGPIHAVEIKAYTTEQRNNLS